MTRTDSMVSGEPQTAGAAKLGSEPHGDCAAVRGRRVARRALLAAPIALALAIPAPALAQTSVTSGYGTKPPVTTNTEPKSGTAPSKESTTPKEKASPAPAATTPATSTAPTTTSPVATESKLPFTGLDLRWVLGAGILMLAAGLSIRLTQRRSARR
jgi:hypothetical protein